MQNHKLLRLKTAIFIISLLTASVFAAAQGAKINPSDSESNEEDADRPLDRDRWFRLGRTVPGQHAAELRYRAYQQKLRQRALRASELRAQQGRTALSTSTATALTSSTGPQWRNLGPAPLISDPSGQQSYGFVSGRATRVLVDQSDATGNTIYLGGALGGLWKSSNAAASPGAVIWTPLLDNQPTLSVGAIAIKPDDNQVLLVGTGESNSSGDSYYGLGILRSTDGGATWNLIPSADNGAHPFKGLGFSRIAFSSNDSTRVVAATAATNGIELGATTGNTIRGLYYSTDAGLSWQLASVTDNSVAITPGSSNSVSYNAVLHTFFAVIRFHGVYSSPDGINWSRLATQPGGALLSAFACPPMTSSSCPIYRGELAVVPGSATMFLWFVDGSNTDEGIYQTTDGGNTWTQFSVAGIDSCGDSSGCGTRQGNYNLTLVAVPTTAGVDLYAGAINLFKCSTSSSNPTCSASGSWKNLAHAYGCTPIAAPSHVHPDQHDISFSLATPNILYFANDGGVYRTLNGPGLTSGSCSVANPFDNLNGTLGSMTQFVSFSLDPTNLSTVLGGTQDNGSPAVSSTSSGTNGVTWSAVNTGDGGFNAINPNNPLEWFTANTDVSIQRCTSGITCTESQFVQVIGKTQVGGDHGDFYTRYQLDPQASGAIIVGTCRVWRGPSSGQGWTAGNALSGSLTGDALPCSGSSSLVIRALAAGGPLGANGSQVIYAGTSGGQAYVTSDADDASPAWSLGNIAALGFPISDIAIDAGDSTGLSAYATVMGFGVGHVFKTGNGTYWQDVSANLPDAPANAVLVDPADSNLVYVGTDIGVFLSTDGGTSWTEYGPAPTSGPGFLPNTPVTRLNAFVNSNTRRLRASTYGRGVWEIDMPAIGPDFVLRVPLSNVAIYPGQMASFPGTLSAVAGYSSSVSLACSAAAGGALPATCSGTSATPASGGTPFRIAASDTSIGDFNFKLVATGTDAAATTRQTALRLRIVNFSLQVPSPPSAIAAAGTTATLSGLTVTAFGSFDGSVTVTCDPASLPGGAACSSATGNPVVGFPMTASISISVAASTPTGAYTIALVAIADKPAGSRRQNLALNVTSAPPDFTVSSNPTGSTTINPGQSVSFNISVAPQSGFNGTVTFACSGLPRLTSCSFVPPSVAPGGSAASTTLTIQTTAPTAASLGIPPAHRWPAAPYALCFSAPAAVLLLRRNSRRLRYKSGIFLFLLLVLGALHVACGGGAGNAPANAPITSPGTAPGRYTVAVQATSGNVSHTSSVTFTVR